jgi:type IV secretory pathway VirB4 component
VPTLSHVVARLKAGDAEDALLAHMELFTQGRLGRLINAPGTVDLTIPASKLRQDVAVLGVDLSAFVQGNDLTMKRVLPAIIANYFITVAMNGNGRPMELIIDEAWTLLATEAGSAMLEVIVRIGRSLKIAATVITQQVREFLYRRVGDTLIPNEAGKTYLDNCETVLLLRQLRPARTGQTADDHPVAMAAKQFGLTPAEMNQLSRCRLDAAGATGLLLVGRETIPLRIPRVPEPLHSEMLLRGRARISAEGASDAG